MINNFLSGKRFLFGRDIARSRFILVGIGGFTLGILPRILSILTGEVKRGGQGFDVDFKPYSENKGQIFAK